MRREMKELEYHASRLSEWLQQWIEREHVPTRLNQQEITGHFHNISRAFFAFDTAVGHHLNDERNKAMTARLTEEAK